MASDHARKAAANLWDSDVIRSTHPSIEVEYDEERATKIIQAAIDAAVAVKVAQEREACAGVCERLILESPFDCPDGCHARACRDAIRARGEG